VRGGRQQEALPGYFVEPTIFDKFAPGSRIFREEVFGPVLAVSTANSLAEALEIANGVEYGLAASIFTQDIDTRCVSWRRPRCGMVDINEATVGGEAQLPFAAASPPAWASARCPRRACTFSLR